MFRLLKNLSSISSGRAKHIGSKVLAKEKLALEKNRHDQMNHLFPSPFNSTGPDRMTKGEWRKMRKLAELTSQALRDLPQSASENNNESYNRFAKK